MELAPDRAIGESSPGGALEQLGQPAAAGRAACQLAGVAVAVLVGADDLLEISHDRVLPPRTGQKREVSAMSARSAGALPDAPSGNTMALRRGREFFCVAASDCAPGPLPRE